MLAALRVGEVGAIVLVDGQTEAALEGAYMVFEKVGVLIKVNRLESEFSKPFSSVRVGAGVRGNTTSSEFGSRTIL
jgi:signal recognition particle receptor subunit beta